MNNIIELARKGDKEAFKSAIKEQLTQRRSDALTNAKTLMARSVGTKK